MAYTKTVWKDRTVEKPRNYTMSDNVDGTITLTPSPGVVTEAGTPIIAANLNNMEDGIEANDAALADKTSKTTDFVNSLITNGWQKLPNGLIIQWGEAQPALTNGAASNGTSFPLSFPNGCFEVLAVIKWVDGGAGGIDNLCTIAITAITNSSFTFSIKNIINTYGSNCTYRFIAVGY